MAKKGEDRAGRKTSYALERCITEFDRIEVLAQSLAGFRDAWRQAKKKPGAIMVDGIGNPARAIYHLEQFVKQLPREHELASLAAAEALRLSGKNTPSDVNRKVPKGPKSRGVKPGENA